ncbi:hypothetical protein A3Q56_02122 [Intoshia linei]|uniref:Tc1-like transposase DDE domain-containing protein n=1 Tax=Intoshia linei TaxID=1819745 RepID=A0A177B7C1_9BILA|nr:hypothetical protein A3Q56_02122 [Intoshia linei]
MTNAYITKLPKEQVINASKPLMLKLNIAVKIDYSNKKISNFMNVYHPSTAQYVEADMFSFDKSQNALIKYNSYYNIRNGIHFDSIIKCTHRGSFKGNNCNDWLRSLIDQCTKMGVISPTFVIDNAPVHRKLESVIRIGEDAEIIRLVPYSYLLNPIELSWSCFKNEIKIKLRDEMR